MEIHINNLIENASQSQPHMLNNNDIASPLKFSPSVRKVCADQNPGAMRNSALALPQWLYN